MITRPLQRLVVATALVAAFGCGKKKDKATGPNTPGPSADDTTESAVSGAEDATDALSEGGANNAVALDLNFADVEEDALVETTADTDSALARACAVGATANSVVVTDTHSGSGTKTASKGGGKVTVTATVTRSGTDTRTWTAPTGQTLACRSATSSAKIDWANAAVVSGLTLHVDVAKEEDRSLSILNSKKATTKTTTANSHVSGTRDVTWATGTDTATMIDRTKTVKYSVTRTRVGTAADGTSMSLSNGVATKDGAPLAVEVNRLKTDGSLQKETIHSGTVVNTLKDGSTVQMAFNEVVYDLTSATPCQPSSGTITGSTFAAGATAAASTFTLNFADATADSGVSITIGANGTPASYDGFNAKECELARGG
jgi:hypothetical protein